MSVDASDLGFVVFSDDWGEHPSSCQHLFREIAALHPVVWVNTIGMRAPTLSLADLRKAVRKIARMFRGAAGGDARAQSLPGQLRLVQPFMLPFTQWRLVRWLNRISVTRAVRKQLQALRGRAVVAVSTVPNACDFVRSFGAAHVVYYCVDDFSQWPGLRHELVRKMEQDMIAAADILVATSDSLHRQLARNGRAVQMLTHGVDLATFGTAACAAHPAVIGAKAPRAGYIGLIDERSDLSFVARLADTMPDFSFVFVGPSVTDTAALGSRPNVLFTGPVKFAELPAVIAGLDVLFIPYFVNEFTATISPLKLKEYLASGKPVVTSAIAEALRYQPHLSVATGLEEWQGALRAAVGVDVAARRQSMAQLLRDESWQAKAQSLLSLCRAAAPHDAAGMGTR